MIHSLDWVCTARLGRLACWKAFKFDTCFGELLATHVAGEVFAQEEKKPEPIVNAQTAEAEQALEDYVWVAHARQLYLGLFFNLTCTHCLQQEARVRAQEVQEEALLSSLHHDRSVYEASRWR